MTFDEQESRFREAMATCGPALGRLAATYEHDPARRTDLLQDVQVALWRSLATFDDRCTLRTWVWRVAHNVAVTHIERSRRFQRRFVTIEAFEDIASDTDGEATIGERLLLERLRAAIRRLQPPDAQIMLLYLEGEDARTIADVTGVSPGAVSTKVHRIKTLLAARFGAEGGQS